LLHIPLRLVRQPAWILPLAFLTAVLLWSAICGRKLQNGRCGCKSNCMFRAAEASVESPQDSSWQGGKKFAVGRTITTSNAPYQAGRSADDVRPSTPTHSGHLSPFSIVRIPAD